MIILYNLQNFIVIRLKFGDIFSTSYSKLVVEMEAIFCSTIKENLFSYCSKFLAFLTVAII